MTMFKTLNDKDKYSEVPEFLEDAIRNLLFEGQSVVYNFDTHYSPARAQKKAHIISDAKPDGTITIKRYIVNYVTNCGVVEVFNITEDKNTW
jgi:hypothetical protein